MFNINMKSKVYNFSTHPLIHTSILNIGLNVNINASIKICGYKNSRFLKFIFSSFFKVFWFILFSIALTTWYSLNINLSKLGVFVPAISSNWLEKYLCTDGVIIIAEITKRGIIFATSHRSLSSKIIF